MSGATVLSPPNAIVRGRVAEACWLRLAENHQLFLVEQLTKGHPATLGLLDADGRPKPLSHDVLHTPRQQQYVPALPQCSMMQQAYGCRWR